MISQKAIQSLNGIRQTIERNEGKIQSFSLLAEGIIFGRTCFCVLPSTLNALIFCKLFALKVFDAPS